MKHRWHAAAAILPIALVAAGCHGNSTGAPGQGAESVDASPGTDAAKEAVSAAFGQYLSTHSAGGEQFQAEATKVDGQPIQIAGTTGYRMFVNATVLLPNGFRPECARPTGRLCILTTGLQPTSERTKLTYNGNIEFTKSERGWLINAVKIDFGTPVSSTVVQADGSPEITTENITL